MEKVHTSTAQKAVDNHQEKYTQRTSIHFETYVFLFLTLGFFGYLSYVMGIGNMFNTIMSTAHDLLLNTVFFIMAVAVLAGAFSSLLSEFGVVELINRMISPVMKPLYDMPGAASLGGVTTYLSDNPAIISLAKDRSFIRYFKPYQVPALCNLGTAFGMGLILTAYMISLGSEFILPSIIGNVGALTGSVVSVRLMLHFTKKYYGTEKESVNPENRSIHYPKEIKVDSEALRYERPQKQHAGLFERFLNAVLEGGKNGVEMGLGIIPGVLVICTIIMILTFGPADTVQGVAVYQGNAFEGIGLLPRIGGYVYPVLQPLFGFQNPEALAFPITSLGAVGAAMGLVKNFLDNGLIGPNDIAVFTAMGMCWSGYLSTHVGMMDVLNLRFLSNKAILSHTVGGLVAGVTANYLYRLVLLFTGY